MPLEHCAHGALCPQNTTPPEHYAPGKETGNKSSGAARKRLVAPGKVIRAKMSGWMLGCWARSSLASVGYRLVRVRKTLVTGFC